MKTMTAPTSLYQSGQKHGDYMLDRSLGVGGSGEVWLAENLFIGVKVAIKFCHDPVMQETLRNEARTLGDLLRASGEATFPGDIVRLLETHLSETPPSLVMEYCAGGDLRQLLKEETQLSEEMARHVIAAALRALRWAHAREIIHRDIKPENILLKEAYDSAGGELPQVKVGDFGLGLPATVRTLSIHRSLDSGTLSQVEGTSSGTLEYMSPEQIEGRELGPPSDIYAVGVVLFEILTGRRPRGAILPSALRPGLDPKWDRLFERCYAYDPMQRFSSAQEMLEALEGKAYLAAITTGPSDRPSTPARQEAAPEGGAKPSVAEMRRNLAEADHLTFAFADDVKGAELYEVRDDADRPVAQAAVQKSYSWPDDENPRVKSAEWYFRLGKQITLLLFVLSLIPFTRFLLGPFAGVSPFAFLGLFLLFVLVQSILGDFIFGVDGGKKSRLILRPIADPQTIAGRLQPSPQNSSFLEMRGPDQEILGYLHLQQKMPRWILDAGGQQLFDVELVRRKARLPSGPVLKRYYALRRANENDPLAYIGRVRHGKKPVALWIDPEAGIDDPTRLLLTLSGLAVAAKPGANWN